MAISILMIGAIAVGIYIIFELMRFKHKITAIVLIGLLLFFYFGVMMSVRGHDINWNSWEGFKQGSQIYMNWLGISFGNVKALTTHAIKLDWRSEPAFNESLVEE